MPISDALKIEKNKLSAINPWLILLDVTVGTGEPLRLVKNIDDITYQGNVYTAFPMEITMPGQFCTGEIPDVTINISNADRVLQGYIEDINGAVDKAVVMRIVHAGNLADDFSDFERYFTILAAGATNEWVSFGLGLRSPTTRRFPLFRTMGLHCNWVFKGYECGYSGSSDTCDHTLKTCQGFNDPDTFSQSKRFGGFPGLNSMGVKFV